MKRRPFGKKSAGRVRSLFPESQRVSSFCRSFSNSLGRSFRRLSERSNSLSAFSPAKASWGSCCILFPRRSRFCSSGTVRKAPGSSVSRLLWATARWVSLGRPFRVGRATSALWERVSSFRDGSRAPVDRVTSPLLARSMSSSWVKGRKAAVERDSRRLSLSRRMPVSAGRAGGTAVRACPVQFTSRRSLTLFISEGQGWAGGSRARRMTRVRAGTCMAWRGKTKGCGCNQA